MQRRGEGRERRKRDERRGEGRRKGREQLRRTALQNEDFVKLKIRFLKLKKDDLLLNIKVTLN
jgi:hypothetical protein